MELHGPRVVLRSTVPADVERLRAIHREPAVARWWWQPEDGWPLDDGDEPANLLTVWLEDAIIGFVQFDEELDPRYRGASIDIFLASAQHGQGLGTETLEVLCAHLMDDRGHHRVSIDPAVDNAAAIRSYRRAGFRPVGVMVGYERDPGSGALGDGLLMERVRHPAAPVTPPRSDVTLVAATGEDVEAVVAFERAAHAAPFVGAWTAERYAQAVARDDEELLIVHAGGGPAGFVLLAGVGGDVVELRRIVVARPGEGIGRAALEQTVERVFDVHRPHRLWLDVVLANTGARRLYEALGFVPEGLLRDAHRDGDRRADLLLMALLRPDWVAARGG